MYFRYSQALMTFADAFANGFVLEKRTHLRPQEGLLSSTAGPEVGSFSGNGRDAHPTSNDDG